MDGKNIHADYKHKKVDTTILISDKIDFKKSSERSIQLEDIMDMHPIVELQIYETEPERIKDIKRQFHTPNWGI